jgi:hypothetical protein
MTFEAARPDSAPQPVIETPATTPEAGPEPPGESGAPAASGALEGSTEAKRLAAAILEVLAGIRGPSEAAKVLGISLARYYQLETRALAGLLGGCEPRRRGGRRGSNELTSLRQECDRLRRGCARQQALVRAAQRTVGLAAPPLAAPVPPPGTAGRKRRKRRPKARALKVAALLRNQDGEPAKPEVASGAAQDIGSSEAP